MSFRIADLTINVTYQAGDEHGVLTVVLCNSLRTHGCEDPNHPCRPHKTKAYLLVPADHSLTADERRELKQQLAEALEDFDYELE
jgi:hypothetical protein